MSSQAKGEGEGRALGSWDVDDTLDWSMAVCYQSVKNDPRGAVSYGLVQQSNRNGCSLVIVVRE